MIEAGGRGDWIGWVELAKEQVNEVATRMTAQVIGEVQPDVLAVVEAEDRPSLVRFNSDHLGRQFGSIMLFDGNDERGIDVGIMTAPGTSIGAMRSNVELQDEVGLVFSRDCPQYQVHAAVGGTLHVPVNHFKSQSRGGGQQRARQTQLRSYPLDRAPRRLPNSTCTRGSHSAQSRTTPRGSGRSVRSHDEARRARAPSHRSSAYARARTARESLARASHPQSIGKPRSRLRAAR